MRNTSDNSEISREYFSHDLAGNILDAHDGGFQYDINNRLIVFNGDSVSYDLDGNMLSNGSLTCSYDSANRLVSAGGHTYTYNAESVRIRNLCEDEDTTYTYNTNAKLSMLLMKTTNGVVTKYVYGKGLIGEETANTFKTYHFDCRGSTIAITDASGNITDTFAYDTYGKLLSRTGTNKVIFGYNGRDGVVTDDNGLIYMRARYYSPEMKRFINADVIPGKLSNTITLNRFAYANGNPVSFVDPFGLFVNWLKEKGRQVKDGWNTYVAEPFQEHIVEPVSEAWNTYVAEPFQEHIVEPISEAWNTYVAEPVEEYVVEPIKENIIEPAKKYLNDEVVQPALDYLISNAPKPIANFAEDIKNYDRNNTNEQKVLESHYFSAYKDNFVLNLPIGNNAFSCGIIFMGTGVPDTEYDTVKHEYGHTVQFDNMGFWNYLKKVGIPSVTAYNLDKNGKLPYDYYTAPWEADADMYGGVSRTPDPKLPPWDPSIGYYDFGDLLRAWLNM